MQAATMTQPGFIQVDDWDLPLAAWLAFGAIFLEFWILEGVDSRHERCWRFKGVARLPFGAEDADWLRWFMNGPGRARILDAFAARARDRSSRATQVPEGWDQDPAPLYAPRVVPGAAAAPRPPTFNAGRPYNGIGRRELLRRLHAFVEGQGGHFIMGEATPDFYRQVVSVQFTVTLPFAHEASRRIEGGRRASRWNFAENHPSTGWIARQRETRSIAIQTDAPAEDVSRHPANMAWEIRGLRRWAGQDEFT